MRIYLIGNFPPDKQESMNRFAFWLQKNLHLKGVDIRIDYPLVFFARICNKPSGIGKWLGYIDKFILYPIKLHWMARLKKNKHAIFHVVDHSNAFYANVLPKNRTIITCHDVLAIRGGLGDEDAWCKASKTGEYLQKWILRNLQRSPIITFVSKSTQDDYLTLNQQFSRYNNPQQERLVVLNGINNGFQVLQGKDSTEILQKDEQNLSHPYFFHIGSNLPRKNRSNIIKAYKQFTEKNDEYELVFAGKEFSKDEKQVLDELGVNKDRIHMLGKVSHDVLNALYSKAVALVFPSYSEGFGWPVIEAQACGCPVITSNRTSLPEVIGDAGITCNPDRVDEICEAMIQMTVPSKREAFIEKGFTNVCRFDESNSIDRYFHLYERTLKQIQ